MIVIYNFNDFFINKTIQLELKDVANKADEINKNENNSHIKSHQNDSLEPIIIKEDLVVQKSIAEINHITGNYYIISGSFSNYNLSLNKANNLIDEGFNAIIIFQNS